MDFNKVIDEFNKYTSNYDLKIKEFNLKYYHSFEVSKIMKELAIRLNLNEEEIILSQIIGLLHDIGRFEQFKKYGTLNDSKSSDHADESCIYLFDEGHIRDFIEDVKYDEIIKYAIKNHNKKEIDNNITDKKILLFCKMIRDADKIDIFRVYSVYYEYNFNAEEVSERMLELFKNEEIIDLSERKSKSDAIILVLAFIFDINFNDSFDLLVELDNFDLFLSSINVDKDSEKLFKKLKEICFDKINRGVEE